MPTAQLFVIDWFMTEPINNHQKEILSSPTGIFCRELDLVALGSDPKTRTELNEHLNQRRERMPKLDAISCMVVDGGDDNGVLLRDQNAELLRIASEAALFKLLQEDPRSKISRWSKEDGGGGSPHLIRKVDMRVRDQLTGEEVRRPVVALCLVGITARDEGKHYFEEPLKDDFISELGFVLTQSNLRYLYPQSWEGKQAYTLQTVDKN